jgi:hypothetical protein
MKQDALAVSGYVDDIPGAKIDEYYHVPGYNDIGIGITAEKWKKIDQKADDFLRKRVVGKSWHTMVDGVPMGYDIYLDNLCKKEGMVTIKPRVTRCIHIGQFGEHCNANTHYSHLMPRKLTSDDFDIPTTYRKVG